MELLVDENFGHNQFPVGYRFLPTDEELVTHYLINKVFCNPIPASIFQEMNATEFYSKSPKRSVQFSSGEREWFIFIKENEENVDNEQNETIRRIVGDEQGFWQCNGEEPLYDANGNVLAFKFHLTYFSGCLSKAKKTHWKLDKYRLPIQFYTLHNSKVIKNSPQFQGSIACVHHRLNSGTDRRV
ncbi:hypothetical protein DITRI_Ditri03aG0104100 [Diplodiscus trichospermus]